MALKLASKPELTFYFLVVVCLQLLVLRDGMQLSEDAAAALATPSSHFRLPARLTSMLQIPPAFVQARKTQAEDGASVWWYMIQRPVAWFLNRPRDVSDIQWRDFRGGLGPLAAAMAAFVVLSRLARLRSTRLRMLNNVMASILFIGITHGPTGTLWVFLLASVSYLLIKAVAGTHYGPAVIWGWHCASFLFIRWNNGLRFSSLSPRLSFLDGHSSMLRWHIHYNFLLLRLLSFAMDLHWARKQQQQQQQQRLAKQESGTPEQQQLLAWANSIRSSNPKARVEAPLPLASYSYLQHFVYCFYPPLYIAGPTITFNDFASQIAAPPRQSAREVSACKTPAKDATLIEEVHAGRKYIYMT